MRRTILLLALLTASLASASEPQYLVTFADSVEVTEELVQQVARTYGAAVEDVRGNQVILRVSVSRAQLLSSDARVRTIAALSTELIDWNSGVAYTYDGAGNIRQIGTDTFVYDAVGRLVRGQTAGIARNFSYDAFGNRTACTEGGVPCQTTSHTYSAFTNQSPAMQYDPAGNVTSVSGHLYDYDALQMQIRDRAGTTSRESIYTADDERIAVYHVGGWWNWTVRDPSGRVLREFTSQGASGTSSWRWSKDYIWRDSLLLATIQPDATPDSVGTHHDHLDHLGTPRRITDAADRIVGHHDYHPFGPERPGGRDEPSLTALKYTGHERDGSDPDALDYMHARYYSAALGRFLSVDPGRDWDVGVPQSWNSYAYARNDPLKYVGETGEFIRYFVRKLASGAYRETTRDEAVRVAGDRTRKHAVKITGKESDRLSSEARSIVKDGNPGLRAVRHKAHKRDGKQRSKNGDHERLDHWQLKQYDWGHVAWEVAKGLIGAIPIVGWVADADATEGSSTGPI